MSEQTEALKDRIKRLEMTLARCGDEYLAKVCCADINSLRKQLKAMEPD